MATYDLVVRNGIVVDGTGLPRRRADVAVKDGRIADVGFVEGDGAREIDADGRGRRARASSTPTRTTTRSSPSSPTARRAASTASPPSWPATAASRSPRCGPATRRGSSSCSPGSRAWTPSALEGIPFDGFETFPEFLDHIEGRLGINAAFYVGHCAVRRYVMGDDCQAREATADEIDAMAAIVADAMAAGAAGFSSTHSPDALRLRRPAGPEPAVVARRAAGARRRGRPRRHGGSIAYLPGSAVGGITPEDEELLVDLSLSARMPVIIQGLGARSKIDAPTAGWDNAKRFVDEATAARARPCTRWRCAKPFNRTFDLAAGTKLYEGALEFHRMFTEAPTVDERIALLRDPVVPRRDPRLGRATRTATPTPGRRCRRRTGTCCTSTR